LENKHDARSTRACDPVSTAGKTGLCVEAHDLAASKLAAYRPKDKEFVRQLLIEKMIDDKVLAERLDSLKIEEQLRERLIRWVNVTAEDLKSGQGRQRINDNIIKK
jgi:hypothetical protein